MRDGDAGARRLDDAATVPDSAAELRALIARGDRRGALTTLMKDYGDTVYGLCKRVLSDDALAQDVLQQVFIEAYRDLDRFEGRSSIRSWLLGIASHRCTDALRVRQRLQQRFENVEPAAIEYVDPARGALERLDRAQLLRALEDCLAKLSDDARMTILLRFQAGMSYEEMARKVPAKSDTLQTRVARALPALRRCLEARGWSGE